MMSAIRIVGLVFLLVPMIAMAQANFVSLNESNGAAMYVMSGVTNYGAGSLAVDPSGGSANGQALVFTLPFNFTNQGDVVMQEPDLSGMNDVIRFWGNNQIIFYSDPADNDLADLSGLPTNSFAGVTVPEIWPSGWDNPNDKQWADYIPGASDPGYAGANFVQYEFISQIPEPSTLALVGLGLVGLAFKAYRRRSE